MIEEAGHLKLVLILALGFASAGVLGYLSHLIKLSPVLGYLVAGYLIGPNGLGFMDDAHFAQQLAEVGVVLMMFGVGLHFKWNELSSVKSIAIPGAIGQLLLTTIIGCLLFKICGWDLTLGLIMSLAIGIASTVVMIRVLEDQQLLQTPRGYLAVGWLIVEDVITVILLILMPLIASLTLGTAISLSHITYEIVWALTKFSTLIILTLLLGRKIVAYSMFKIAQARSSELFTLAVLAFTFVIASLSAVVFGTSIALGAFIAGLVIGQTEVRHQAFADALPIKDAFMVIFFLSIGMLFDPISVANNKGLFILTFALILVIKPLVAYLLAVLLRCTIKVALTIAVSLAQIGEFSFILAQEAMKNKLFHQESYDVVIACALLSISLNPLLFIWIDKISNKLESVFQRKHNKEVESKEKWQKKIPQALIIGFGPIGQNTALFFIKKGYLPTVVEYNIETTNVLKQEGWQTVYGDASSHNILSATPIKDAKYLIITTTKADVISSIIHTARKLNPNIEIVVRSRYIRDQPGLERLGVKTICCEHESMKAFSRTLSIAIGMKN
jgi:CPA2 family monovalent cation:H+ antiporter-2